MKRGRYTLALPVLIFWGTNCPGAEFYTARRIGNFAWSANDINEKGEVVGAFDSGIYFNGEYSRTIAPLGGSGHFSYSTIHSINNNALMVGESTTGIVNGNTGPRRAFLFNANVGFTRELGSLGGSTGASAAYAINDLGVAVGESKTTNGTHAVRFELDGTITDLGTLGGDASVATDITEKGDIVGAAQNNSGLWRAFLIPAGGSMKDLGTLGGDESRARAINKHGEIVGSATSTNGQWRAFIYADDEMHDLGAMGTSSHAFDINDSGTIVGMEARESGLNGAFVRYADGTVHNLDELVSLPEGNWLAEARAINNAGFIATMEFQPISRTGVNFVTVLHPGAVTGRVNGNNWEVTASVPPGSELRLEGSIDLTGWSNLETVSGGNTTVHRESLQGQSRFLRAVLQ